jgi:hypothetical protein
MRKDLVKGRILWRLLFCLLVHLLHWHSGISLLYYTWGITGIRTRLKGDSCGDCCSAFWCTCCTDLQIWRCHADRTWKRFSLKGDSCGDCCSAFWCTCCTGIQVWRLYHTWGRTGVSFKGRILWVLLFCLQLHLLHWHSGMAVIPCMRQNRRKDSFKGKLLWRLLFCLLLHLLHWT